MRYSEKLRIEVAQKYCETGNAKIVAKEFNIPIWSVYRWGKLYHQNKKAGLQKKSTRPLHSPKKISSNFELAIIKIWFKLQKRTFTNVKTELAKHNVTISLPTIKSVLFRQGIIDDNK